MPAPSPLDPGSQLKNPVRGLSTGQQWYKPPHARYENTSDFGAEKISYGIPTSLLQKDQEITCL